MLSDRVVVVELHSSRHLQVRAMLLAASQQPLSRFTEGLQHGITSAVAVSLHSLCVLTMLAAILKLGHLFDNSGKRHFLPELDGVHAVVTAGAASARSVLIWIEPHVYTLLCYLML